MTKTELLQDPDSCLNKAAPDEPLFVLRANDPIAPYIVEHWASMYITNKRLDGEVSRAQLDKMANATVVAAGMRTWLYRRHEVARHRVAQENDCDRAGDGNDNLPGYGEPTGRA